jgi:hypothetical protein
MGFQAITVYMLLSISLRHGACYNVGPAQVHIPRRFGRTPYRFHYTVITEISLMASLISIATNFTLPCSGFATSFCS